MTLLIMDKACEFFQLQLASLVVNNIVSSLISDIKIAVWGSMVLLLMHFKYSECECFYSLTAV